MNHPHNARSSLYIALILPVLAVLACAGATAGSVRIRDLPQFICATSTPLATHTQLPTEVHPPVHLTPSGYATFTPQPGCLSSGGVCVTRTPLPGGIYSTPGVYLPGATSTPRPTHTPYPTPTPFILTGRFFIGADVYTGGFASEVSLRLRLDGVQVYAVDAVRQVVAWEVEIENVGQVTYHTIPGGQVFVAEVETLHGAREGQWWAGQDAARTAGVPLHAQALDALQVHPGERYRFTLTAFTPVGVPTRFGWVLDPLADGRDGDLVGGNVTYWASDVHAGCTANPGAGAVIPTLSAPAPTPTPTRTPQYPPWCGWCGG